MAYNVLGFSEQGRVRESNQDSIFYAVDGERAIALVADGMGGYEGGERASNTVMEHVKRWWRLYHSRTPLPGFWKSVNELQFVLYEAHAAIREENGPDSMAGTTAVILWAEQGMWAVISVGDSRCYQASRPFLKVRINQLTVDDVWENQESVRNKYTDEEIECHEDYGKLTKAVGVHEIAPCSVYSGRFRKNVVYLLCSDGTYRYCSDEAFWDACGLFIDGEMETGMALVKKSIYQNGAPDNLSLVLVWDDNT